MKDLTILKPEIQDKLKTNIFSAVEVVNNNLCSHLIVDEVYFFAAFVSVRVGTTSKANNITGVEINSLCRFVTEAFLKCGVVTISPCRLMAIDFEDSVISLVIDL